ncbi:MDR family MFS transporter [Aureibacter tunicatorum]|uniref:MFS family arabinose efflux permease n=1 Tax=Aureibacter tunicatorum TaxID=866807 RepID=A0AAE4BSZ2_9BACT|nr:MFS transporter [Aureibacter tunicatorum]MDR6241689.1 putative MFS family arabinose efflux permease [Aureibacter tunicatorum]BDD07325.1 MFS transporter [Aureibacter tunicatorum]
MIDFTLTKFKNSYLNAYKGLSKEIWWLAFITLINRAGTMVMPFLTLYLQDSLNFSISQVGTILTCFGIGSFVGSWIGGKLTDKIGYYKVMLSSLIMSGVSFLFLQAMDTFLSFCLGIFITTVFADAFRPAIFVAINSLSKPENVTRSVTLIRLAINLGFAVGPFVGGLIITSIGYYALFWIDGVTCVSAGFLLYMVLKPKASLSNLNLNSASGLSKIETEEKATNYQKIDFGIFLLIVLFTGIAFMQLFSIIPLYHKDVYNLSEWQIGMIISLNGLLIFAFEMPLVHLLEEKKFSKLSITIASLFLILISFAILNFEKNIAIILVSMTLLTFGEMLAFPSTNKLALDMADKNHKGQYMALYSMSFSLAHIISGKMGSYIVEMFGFTTNWNLMVLILTIAILLSLFLKLKISKRSKAIKELKVSLST